MHDTAKVGANYRMATNQVERAVSSLRGAQVRTRGGSQPLACLILETDVRNQVARSVFSCGPPRSTWLVRWAEYEMSAALHELLGRMGRPA
jgi:hypothetical protein